MNMNEKKFHTKIKKIEKVLPFALLEKLMERKTKKEI